MLKNQKTLLLIDGSSLAFRMFFALERTGLTTPDGRPSWAVFGFMKALMDVIAKEKPDLIIPAFDAKGGTFRSDKFDYYKANRPTEMPEALATQWPEIQRCLNLIGMNTIEKKGLEADDIIGILSTQASKAGWKVLILTGDRDAFQLVNDQVFCLYPTNTGLQKMDEQAIKEKMGVPPSQIVDFKALCGDSSDNIPGVPGIGEKTAANLLNQFKDLDEVYSNLDQVSSKSVRAKLEAGKQSAYDSKFLAQIILESSEISFDFEATHLHPEVDVEGIKSFIQEYRLHSLEKALPGVLEALGSKINLEPTLGLEESTTTDDQNLKEQIQNQIEIQTVKSLFDLDKQLKDVIVEKNIGLTLRNSDSNLELLVSGFNTKSSQLVLFSHAIGSEVGELNEWFGKLSTTHNLYTYDAKTLRKLTLPYGIHLPMSLGDVMLGAYVDGKATKYETLNLWDAYSDLLPKSTFHAENVADLMQLIIVLGRYFEANLPSRVKQLWLEIECPLTWVLARMELNGIFLDQKQLHRISKEMTELIAKLETQILQELDQGQINLNSSQQLGVALLAKGYKLGKTSGGKVSTDRSVLDKLLLEDESGLIAKIIEHRTLSKLQSTYTLNLLAQISPKDNRIHGEFMQTVAATGRLSSTNPNLQNIPIRDARYGKLFRSSFIAEPGYKIIAADYSQIELRFLAHFCGDPVLLDAFQKAQDIHARTAAEIFEIPIEQVDSSQRRLGKTLNFALVYQQGTFATAQMLGISNKQAGDFIKKYFEKFGKVKPFVEEVLENARKNGYVETFWGRRRHFHNLNSSQVILRKNEERAAFNAVLQGSNADLIKIAMLAIDSTIVEQKLDAKIILQVHDELVLEVAAELAQKVQQMVLEKMVLDQPLKVPILVEAGLGQNWAEAKD
ncbi:MAG: DNA polymerase I [Patescibacteria group bacterium]